MQKNKAILIFNKGNRILSTLSSELKVEEYNVFDTSLPLEAIHILQKNEIDIVLASDNLEGMEKDEFKELAEKIRPGVNILFLQIDQKISEDDSLNLRTEEFGHFIRNHLKTENRLLGECDRFKDFFFSFTDRLLQVFEVNNRYFFNNDHMVASMSRKIAVKMGLNEQAVDAVHISALIRDLGKIGVQHQLLDEKGRLGKEELTIIKSHPINTVQILKQINFPWNVETIILHHHEHYDGLGYPEGLTGRRIPLGSRIITVVDSYIAMTTERPYRKALTKREAVEEIVKKAGTQFDPEVVEVFLSVAQEEGLNPEARRLLLVLETDETMAALLRLNSAAEDHEVITARKIYDAMRLIRERRPCAIIADMDILQNDGLEKLGGMRKKEGDNDIPWMIVGYEKEIAGRIAPNTWFLPKPLDVIDLLAKIEKAAVLKKPGPPVSVPAMEEIKGVAGNLEDLSLVDIIQVLNLGLKTAKVILIRDKEVGEIYMRNGSIMYVSTGNLRGHDAFFRLMQWYKGIFKIFHGHTIDETNITMDTMNLLLEASRVLDESRLQKNRS